MLHNAAQLIENFTGLLRIRLEGPKMFSFLINMARIIDVRRGRESEF